MSYDASIPDADDIRRRAEELVRLAAAAGVVLTVEQVPLQPPAMGNYETRVSVRAARTREERGALPYCLRADGRACTCVSPCAIALEVALQEVRPLRVIQEGGDA